MAAARPDPTHRSVRTPLALGPSHWPIASLAVPPIPERRQRRNLPPRTEVSRMIVVRTGEIRVPPVGSASDTDGPLQHPVTISFARPIRRASNNDPVVAVFLRGWVLDF